MKLTLSKADLVQDPLRFDWALRAVRNPGDAIELESGAVAETLGAWSFPEHGYVGLAPGVTLRLHQGSTLRLSPKAVRLPPSPAPFLHILFVGTGATVTGQGTFDGNSKAHAGVACSGIRFFGKAQVRDVTIVGLSGNRNGAESFAVSGEGPTGGSVVSGVSVRDCASTTPSDYVSGIYLGGTTDNGQESLVENCRVDLGPHGQFAYSSTFATRFQNCYGRAMRWWYTDTGDGVAAIDGATGRASYSAVGSVALPEPGRKSFRRTVVMSGSTIDAEGPDARVVEWWNKPGAQNQGGIAVLHSQLTGFKWRAAVDADSGSILFVESPVNAMDSVAPGSVIPVSFA